MPIIRFPRRPVSLAWLVALIDLAAAGFAAWMVKELDFFHTGLNAAQVLAGMAVALLLLTAVALLWPRDLWHLRAAFGLNAFAVLVVLAVSLWTALTAGTTSNPMWFYWPHATALVVLFAVNLWGLYFVAARTP